MTDQPTQLRAALALTELVTHPDLCALHWTVTPSGVLTGSDQTGETTGAYVDIAAVLTGGTATRSIFVRDGVRKVAAHLRTEWRGVEVDVWASYLLVKPMPEPVPGPSWPSWQLAGELRRDPQVRQVEVVDPTAISVLVEPESVSDWAWWRSRLGVVAETYRGGVATGSGQTAGVWVRLMGLEAGRLAAQAALAGGVR